MKRSPTDSSLGRESSPQDPKHFGLDDFPEHRRHLEEQQVHLGMEACATQEERAGYVRWLVRGIFASDLPGVAVMAGPRMVFGESTLTPIPEFERILNEWKDFPRDQIEKIIDEEQAYARGEHLKLVEEAPVEEAEAS